jgi:hypothetical protein
MCRPGRSRHTSRPTTTSSGLVHAPMSSLLHRNLDPKRVESECRLLSDVISTTGGISASQPRRSLVSSTVRRHSEARVSRALSLPRRPATPPLRTLACHLDQRGETPSQANSPLSLSHAPMSSRRQEGSPPAQTQRNEACTCNPGARRAHAAGNGVSPRWSRRHACGRDEEEAR